MKIPTNKLAILCTAVCATMLAFTHNASANTVLTAGDTYTLGYVYFGIPSGDQARQTYTNDLVGFYNSGCPSNTDCGIMSGQDYFMVNGKPHFGATLPNATFVTNGTNATGIVVLSSYTYLFAKYDGPNAGSVVWYIGNLAGQTIDIPTSWLGYGLSGWTIFSGGGGVPDGGATVMLLGAALGALGMARRFLKR